MSDMDTQRPWDKAMLMSFLNLLCQIVIDGTTFAKMVALRLRTPSPK